MHIAVLVTLSVAILPAAQSTSVATDEMVDCYTGSDCQSSALTTTALDCCIVQNGDSFQRSGSAQCLRCLVFGFDQNQYTLSGSGQSYSLGIQVMKFVTIADRNALTLTVTPQNLDLTNISQFQYFFAFQIPQQQVVFFLQANTASYDIVTGVGDGTALEQDLQFQLLLENIALLSNVGVINLTPTVAVEIQDPDVVGVFFSVAEFRAVEGNPPSAGGTVDANVNRENKALARDLVVTVTASAISHTSSISGDVAEEEDFTAEEKTLVFPRTVGSGGAIILALSAEFQVTADEVNEMDEVFQLELSATDGVGMGIDFSTRQMSVGVIENDDGISIGFVERNQPPISVAEGNSLSLTLEAIAALGATQTERASLPAATLSSTDIQTLLNTDYTLNASTPQPFQVSQGGGILSVTFMAIGTLTDEVVEGNELLLVRAIGQPSVYEITGTNGLVQVSITDQNTATIEFEKTSYSVVESEGYVEVRVISTGARYAPGTFVRVYVITSIDGVTVPATSNVDFNMIAAFEVTFDVQGPTTSSSFEVGRFNLTIISDQTEEQIEQVMLLLIQQIKTPSSLPVVVSSEAALVTIIDDDVTPTVMFVQPSYTISESSVEALVEVLFTGQLDTSFTVNVVGQTETGSFTDQVSFEANVPNQKRTVKIPVSDDNIALESNLEFGYQLLGISDIRVQLGSISTTTLIITDDDMATVTFEQSSYSFAENVGVGIVTVILSNQVAKEIQIRVSGGPGDVPATVENSGTDVNQTIVFQALSSQLTRNVTFGILDDSVGLEDIQMYSLSIHAPDSVTVTPYSSTTVSIIDDEVAEVMVTATSTIVSESSGLVTVCATYSGPSTIVRDITVTFDTTAGTATDGLDYVGGLKQAVIQASSLINIGCVTYIINSDSNTEGDEYFDVAITAVLPSGSTTISQTQTTRVTITDTEPPSTITCSYFQATRVISTFDGTNTYGFNGACEHALLLSGDFGIFIDSLDGSVTNSRIGIRDGTASIVLDINGNVLSQMGEFVGLTIASSGGQTFIDISTRGVALFTSATQISIQVSEDSSLTSVFGLCGDLNGNLVLQDGTSIDASSQTDLEAFIDEYFILPGETFVRQIVRRECGLLANDTESGDPVFTVPLDTGSGNVHEYALCYEMFGVAGFYFNFISDTCVSVNALYASIPENRVGHFRPEQHFVNQITIRASGDSKACVNIVVSLGNDGLCSTTVENDTQPILTLSHGQRYSSDGISVRSYSSHARITVPNCENVQLIMKATCKATYHGVHFIEFKVTRGLNLHPTSHGLIGQFWNIPASVTKYNGLLKDGSAPSNTYIVELRPPNKQIRQFLAFLSPYAWDFSHQTCLYAGDSNAGASYELESPNDSVIEGYFTDYIMDDAFDTSYQFSEFDESSVCQVIE